MLYNPPTGGAADDPFVGKNVAAGTQGSKVPPGAVEYPQREIMNIIAAGQRAGLAAPTNSDLAQMLKAVRSGLLNRFPATGTPDAIAIAPQPVYVGLIEGMRFRFKVPGDASVSNATTSPTLAVNGVAPVALKTRLGAAPAVGDLVGGNVLEAEIWADGSARIQSPLASDSITPSVALTIVKAAGAVFNFRTLQSATRTNASAAQAGLQIPVLSGLVYPKVSPTSNVAVTLGFFSYSPVTLGQGNGASTARLVTSVGGVFADFGLNNSFIVSGAPSGAGFNTPTLVLANLPKANIGLGLTYRRDDAANWNTIFNPNNSDFGGIANTPLMSAFCWEYEPGT